jgi:hypothetical protein
MGLRSVQMEIQNPQQRDVPSPESCWELLERVVASSQLKQAGRMRELLIYVGQRSLKEGHDQIHEQEIGCVVFGRPQGYDTALDNIVRTNVSYLRKRIDAYFESEGLHETLLMEIPRGSYVPVFRYRPAEPPATPATAAALVLEPVKAMPEVSTNSHASRGMFAGLILAGLVILALAGSCVALWIQNRASQRSLDAMQRSFYPWQYEPSVAEFWSNFLGTHRETDIIMSDAFFKLAERRSKRTVSINEYLSGSYIRQLLSEERDPAVRGVLAQVSTWRSANPNHLALARRILALDPLGKTIHLYFTSDYRPDLIEQDNAVLLGSRVTNPWASLFDSRVNFIMKLDSDGYSMVINRAPAAGEQAVYTRTDSAGYCVVAYLPNPSGNSKVLLVEGTSVEATQAGGDFLLSEAQLSNFQKVLQVTKFPYFEVLLKTSQVKGTPLTATIEAYRTYPNLH